MTLTTIALALALAHGGPAASDSLPANLVDDAKRVVTFLNTGHADSLQQHMTPKAQQLRSAAQRDSLWHVLVAQVGPFRRFGRSRVTKGSDNAPTVVLELVFDQQPIEATVAYDVNGQISSIVFRSAE